MLVVVEVVVVDVYGHFQSSYRSAVVLKKCQGNKETFSVDVFIAWIPMPSQQQ